MVDPQREDWDNLFRSYDIRGVFGKQLTKDFSRILGIAISSSQGEEAEVVVGRDARLSSRVLRDSLEAGLSFHNAVTDAGIVSTPMLYFATNHLKKKAGIMITASHNPPEWNGFKIFKQNGSIHGDEMALIKETAKKVHLQPRRQSKGKERIRVYERIFDDYAHFVAGKIRITRRMSVVVDTSNGVCGLFVPKLFKQHGCEILTLNKKPDGRFPAHLPEPKEETLAELKEKVASTGADFGAGYDGDGDRVVFIDGRGRLIPGDLALMIFSQNALTKEKGGKIVYELSCSLAVEEFIRNHGGTPIVEKVGHTFIMDRMIQEKAILGGEKSGHFYFPECNGGDDAIFASLRMTEILSQTNESLSDMFDALPKYPSIFEENFRCSDDGKFAAVEKLKRTLRSRHVRFSDLDGIKLLDKNGWVLIRASNTEPIIRLSAEAKTAKKLDELYTFAKKELSEAIKEC